ncbi:PREDICTED: phosphatidylinositol 5-phosphate 4-kinase type-2 alpha-like [Hipposideros armiger]|uniref:Phosphatidylinositol 5-phosphate 4-kinase type-2 alpha n=1 Tax=Hipposideros armiger TaxID=186990 RepID=A0A8B7QKL1_HIPAR|nr:PREDICTED: phosphatidylinositol 5-phosphate 4-kinase type-2 alpha-like [Hipposideros armiger]
MATPGNLGSSVLASKTKTKKKHFVAQKVKLFRASDPLLSVLMWGVNHSINELSHVQIPVMLMPDDFKAYSKIKVDNHLFNKENMPSHFKFKEYCPMVFRNLRERFGIDDQDFQNSLTRSAPLPNDSQARSGARFHTSYDKRYVIKTITSEDVAEMHNILKKYHQYIVECHGITLLPQFLGMYRLNVDGVEIYVIVTRNVFSHHLSVYRKYDLKDSTVARKASDKEKVQFRSLGEGSLKSSVVTLMLTFVENHGDFSIIGICRSYMDSSKASLALVFGLLQSPLLSQSPSRASASISRQLVPFPVLSFMPNFAFIPFTDSPRKEVYFMAIIDILTHYDAKKKAAHAAKTVKHGAGAEISTVNPEQYSKRFLDFIGHILT